MIDSKKTESIGIILCRAELKSRKNDRQSRLVIAAEKRKEKREKRYWTSIITKSPTSPSPPLHQIAKSRIHVPVQISKRHIGESSGSKGKGESRQEKSKSLYSIRTRACLSPLFRRQQQTTPKIVRAGKMLVSHHVPAHSSYALGLRYLTISFHCLLYKTEPSLAPKAPRCIH